MSEEIKKLIEIYNSEILINKNYMIRFALKNNVAYNVASAKVDTYQRVVEDLEELLKLTK